MSRAVMVACVAAVAALALPATASAAGRAEVKEVRPLAVVADDGTVLRGHVYLPDREAPLATVLEFSPYWGTSYPRSGEATVTAPDGRRTLWNWLAPFIDAGFAVALVNVRGTDQSEGCLQWGTRIDARDGAAVVHSLAREPWSNGRVGMIGHSYPAWMAYLALTEAPPELGAIAIASGIIDPWNLMTRNGAAFLLGPFAMPAATGGLATGALGLQGPAGPSTMLATPPSHLACPRYLEDTVPSADMVVRGDRNAYWDSVDLRPRLERTKVPVLVANGLRQEGHMLQVEGLWTRLGRDKRMVLGQWNHQRPETGGHEAWPSMMVGWFDEHLRGGRRTVTPGVVDFQADGGGWHAASRWPPPASEATLRMSGEHLVAAGEDVVAGTQTFVGRDSDPAPARCADERALYVSPPLEHDVVLAGNFGLDLTLTSTLPDGNLAAVLFHTREVGDCPGPQPPSASPLDGYLHAPQEVRRAVGDLRHAGGHPYGRLFPIGEPTAVTLDSHPFATRIPAGERLVLAVAGGARELFPDARKPRLTVTTGPGVAGALRLPVLEGHLSFAGRD
jgi:predicted acyl esterase